MLQNQQSILNTSKLTYSHLALPDPWWQNQSPSSIALWTLRRKRSTSIASLREGLQLGSQSIYQCLWGYSFIFPTSCTDFYNSKTKNSWTKKPESPTVLKCLCLQTNPATNIPGFPIVPQVHDPARIWVAPCQLGIQIWNKPPQKKSTIFDGWISRINTNHTFCWVEMPLWEKGISKTVLIEAGGRSDQRAVVYEKICISAIGTGEIRSKSIKYIYIYPYVFQ